MLVPASEISKWTFRITALPPFMKAAQGELGLIDREESWWGDVSDVLHSWVWLGKVCRLEYTEGGGFWVRNMMQLCLCSQ
jgi:hypothetical protein